MLYMYNTYISVYMYYLYKSELFFLPYCSTYYNNNIVLCFKVSRVCTAYTYIIVRVYKNNTSVRVCAYVLCWVLFDFFIIDTHSAATTY